jgi:hypothetical protein
LGPDHFTAFEGALASRADPCHGLAILRAHP